MKITGAIGDFEFWRGKVSDGVFDWAVDNYFVKSHTNNHIEGMFNYVDEYVNAHMDHQRMEYALQHVRGRLVEQRIIRRYCNTRMLTMKLTCPSVGTHHTAVKSKIRSRRKV